MTHLGGKKLEMDPMQVRERLPKYAEKFLDLQRYTVQAHGVFGRLDNPYATMSPDYEPVSPGDVLRLLRKGLVYKGLSRSTGACTTRPRSPRPRSSTRSLQPQRLGAVCPDQRPGAIDPALDGQEK